MTPLRDSIRGLLPSSLRRLIHRAAFGRPADERPYAEIFDTADTPTGPGSLVLGIGGGRCGMRWFSRVLDAHDNCLGSGERFGELEALYRYVTYHDIPVDMTGFVLLLQQAVRHDWLSAEVSALYSPFLAFGLEPVLDELRPDELVLHLRRPEAVVNSLYVKGWYAGNLTQPQANAVPGPQPLYCKSLYHNFSRILPRAPYWEKWSRLTRIGKIAWYFVTSHESLLASYEAATRGRRWTMKLEDIDQDYDYYRMFSEAVGLRPVLERLGFLRMKAATPNVGVIRRRSTDDWSPQERADFEAIVGPFRNKLDALKTTWT